MRAEDIPISSPKGGGPDMIYLRLSCFMVATSVLTATFVGWRWGWRVLAGFVLGSGIGIVNYLWLKHVVHKATEPERLLGGKSPVKGVVTLFLFRYALIGLGAYAIFKSSLDAFYGFFAGLLLPVAAIGFEAAYQVWCALRGNTE